MFRLTKEQSSRMNIDSVIFPNISEQLHSSDIYVYLYITHPVTEHADKLYLYLRLTEMCFKRQVAELHTV
jgi:hypothetical protein